MSFFNWSICLPICLGCCSCEVGSYGVFLSNWICPHTLFPLSFQEGTWLHIETLEFSALRSCQINRLGLCLGTVHTYGGQNSTNCSDSFLLLQPIIWSWSYHCSLKGSHPWRWPRTNLPLQLLLLARCSETFMSRGWHVACGGCTAALGKICAPASFRGSKRPTLPWRTD